MGNAKGPATEVEGPSWFGAVYVWALRRRQMPTPSPLSRSSMPKPATHGVDPVVASDPLPDAFLVVSVVVGTLAQARPRCRTALRRTS